MLLEMDNSALLSMLASPRELDDAVSGAIKALDRDAAQKASTQKSTIPV